MQSFPFLSRKFTISKTIGETHLYQTEEEESSGLEPSAAKNPPAKNPPENSDQSKKEDVQPGLSNDVSSLLEDAPPTQKISEDAPPTHSLLEEDGPPTHSPSETDNGGRDSEEETDVNHESRHHSSRYSEDEGEGEMEEQEREGEEQEREGEQEEQGNVSLRRIDAQEKVEDPQLLEALRKIQNKI
jgi:hypothetical protein